MTDTDVFPKNTSARVLLWAARGLAVLILSFCGYFLVAHIVGDAGAPSRPLRFSDYAGLFLLIASLVGLGLALKWPRFGAMATLLAVALGAAFNLAILMPPLVFIPIAAVLFLIATRRQGSIRFGSLR